MHLSSVSIQAVFATGLVILKIASAEELHKTASTPNTEDSSGLGLEAIDHWSFSPIHLKLLSRLEQDLFKVLATNTNKQISGEASPDPKDLHWWLLNLQETYFNANLNPRLTPNPEWASRIAEHPFLAFRMIKRFSRLIEMLKMDSIYSAVPEILRKALQFELFMPNDTDVEHVIESIIELQFLYDLRTDDLLIGKFDDTETGIRLRLSEAFEFGTFAYKSKYFPEALDWLETVYMEMQHNSDTSMAVSREDVFSLILNLTREHDELIDTISSANHFYSDHFHRFTRKIASKNQLTTMKEFAVADFEKTQDRSTFPAYSLLCAGEDIRSEIERSELYCWLNRKSDLAWTLSPLKIEVHSIDPYVIQIHQLIGDQVAERLTRVAIGQMQQGYFTQDEALVSVPNVSMLRSVMIDERIKEHGKFVQALDKTIERITRLAVSNIQDPYFLASEQLKITSYAFGGQFYPHFDAYGTGSPDEPESFSDRVATFMIYLNDVRRGGYTVFPKLGMHVVPEKGSALFWFNLLRNGKPDQRVLHGACPVILGQKWIATKWIRQSANFRKRPCSLDPSI